MCISLNSDDRSKNPAAGPATGRRVYRLHKRNPPPPPRCMIRTTTTIIVVVVSNDWHDNETRDKEREIERERRIDNRWRWQCLDKYRRQYFYFGEFQSGWLWLSEGGGEVHDNRCR
ncbi:hypothetical protein Hanom_Chr14g01259201 [Helianthus anomalus]